MWHPLWLQKLRPVLSEVADDRPMSSSRFSPDGSKIVATSWSNGVKVRRQAPSTSLLLVAITIMGGALGAAVGCRHIQDAEGIQRARRAGLLGRLESSGGYLCFCHQCEYIT